MQRLFVSYSRQDEWALQALEALQNLYSVVTSMDVELGAEGPSVFRDVVNGCDLFLAFTSGKRGDIAAEQYFALGIASEGQIPILVVGSQPEVHVRLRHFQFVSARALLLNTRELELFARGDDSKRESSAFELRSNQLLKRVPRESRELDELSAAVGEQDVVELFKRAGAEVRRGERRAEAGLFPDLAIWLPITASRFKFPLPVEVISSAGQQRAAQRSRLESVRIASGNEALLVVSSGWHAPTLVKSSGTILMVGFNDLLERLAGAELADALEEVFFEARAL